MTLHKSWGAIALMAATALGAAASAGPSVAQTTGRLATPAIRREISVRNAPVNTAPDADEPDADAGLEAREAVGADTAGSLNAQYAMLRASAPIAAASPEPPKPATGPSVALARRVVESAQAFADYMRRATAVRPDYVDAAGVSQALRAGGVYEAGQVQEGAVAYVALAALQDRAFVQAVGELGRETASPSDMALSLAADPRAVLRTPGASAAALRAAGALGRLGQSLYGSGAAVKQSAYDIQHSAWSRAAVAEPDVTLAQIKARSAVREGLADGGQAMLTSLMQLREAGDADGSGRLTPVVARGLTLAALAVLGEAGEEHADRVATLLTEVSSAQCLKMARLNLYQCLSVAGPNYEDVFCLGQHAMMETARCVADASGWTPATAVEAPAAPVLRAASIMVPVDFAPPAARTPTTSPAGESQPPTGPTSSGQPAASAPTLQMASAGMG